jgi:hypothetical protein
VVFLSWASDLVPSDTNGFRDVFARDLMARTNALVSVATDSGLIPGHVLRWSRHLALDLFKALDSLNGTSATGI